MAYLIANEPAHTAVIRGQVRSYMRDQRLCKTCGETEIVGADLSAICVLSCSLYWLANTLSGMTFSASAVTNSR